jgi:hypothetical protein
MIEFLENLFLFYCYADYFCGGVTNVNGGGAGM